MYVLIAKETNKKTNRSYISAQYMFPMGTKTFESAVDYYNNKIYTHLITCCNLIPTETNTIFTRDESNDDYIYEFIIIQRKKSSRTLKHMYEFFDSISNPD